MTPAQRDQVAKLARCRFYPGGFDKRFVRTLVGYAEDVELSPRQAEVLDVLTHKYRRQIANRERPNA